jgi:thiol-disulfide isomerase/thioredoxin
MSRVAIAILCLMIGNYWCNAAFSENVIVKGTISGVQTDKVVLYQYGNKGQFVLGESAVINEAFEISKSKNIVPGIYTLQFSISDFIEIQIPDTINGILLEINKSNTEVKINFLNSEVNNEWQLFNNRRKQMERKISALYNFIIAYPEKNNKIVKYANEVFKNELKLLENERHLFLKQVVGTGVYKYEMNRPTRIPNPNLPDIRREIEMREKFWEGITTTDESLINTPLYSGLIYDYLSYYLKNNNIDKDSAENGLKFSIDTIAQRFKGSEETYRFAINYMTDGFKQIGLDNILKYIDTRYNSAERCENDKEKDMLQKRLDSYDKLNEGNIAPDIYYDDNKGLSDISADTIIIAFWASWCSHCMKEIPLLNNMMDSYGNIKTLAISLDTDATAYFETIKRLGNLLHYCDFASWDSEPAKNYYIFATPTFIAVNKDRKILRKFDTVNDISDWLK